MLGAKSRKASVIHSATLRLVTRTKTTPLKHGNIEAARHVLQSRCTVLCPAVRLGYIARFHLSPHERLDIVRHAPVYLHQSEFN